MRDQAGLLWRYDIGHIRCVGRKVRMQSHNIGFHPNNATVIGGALPTNAVAVQTLPALLKQGLLGKTFIAVQYQDLALGLCLLK